MFARAALRFLPRIFPRAAPSRLAVTIASGWASLGMGGAFIMGAACDEKVTIFWSLEICLDQETHRSPTLAFQELATSELSLLSSPTVFNVVLSLTSLPALRREGTSLLP